MWLIQCKGVDGGCHADSGIPAKFIGGSSPAEYTTRLQVDQLQHNYSTLLFIVKMENSTRSTQAFDVFLRLRPSLTGNTERFLLAEGTTDPDQTPQFVTIQPPANDPRKRAVEQFAFTKIFHENSSQLDIFQGTGVLSLIDGILGADGRSRDGLLATLGVTGSGKV